MGTHVELQSLWRSFGHVTALKGIDLALEEGEFVSLLGPSSDTNSPVSRPRSIP